MTDCTVPVTFNVMKRAYMRGDKKLYGLLELLKLRFYPHYEFTKATFNRQRVESEYAERKRNRGATKLKTRKRGFQNGIKLDQEITQTVNFLLLNPDLDTSVFYNTLVRQADKTASPAIKKVCESLLLETRRFWHTCRSKQLVPYATQHIVSDGPIAHSLDVLCRDPNGSTWIVEIKSGYENYMTACTKQRMSAPLHCQTDSKENQHQLQLAAQKELFSLQHPDVVIGGCMVLHLHSKGITEYPLKPWAAAITGWVALIRPKNDAPLVTKKTHAGWNPVVKPVEVEDFHTKGHKRFKLF